MTPCSFPQANTVFNRPPDMAESQCMDVPAHLGEAVGGSLDGVAVVVVAWLPDEAERRRIAEGGPVFLSVVGGLLPHFLCTDFEQATRPA